MTRGAVRVQDGGSGAAASLSDAERRLKRLLRIAAGLFLALIAALIVAHVIGALGAALREPPWVGGTVGTGLLLMMVCAYAAGDPRRRPGLVGVLAVTLVAAALAQLAYLLAGAGSARPLGEEVTSSDSIMILVLALELAVAAGVLAAAAAARRAQLEGAASPAMTHWRSDADAGLRPLLVVLGALSAILAGAAAVGPFLDSLRELFDQPLLSAHLAAGAAGAAALCFYVVGDVRNRIALVGIIAFALAVAAVAGLLGLQDDRLDQELEILGLTPRASAVLWTGIGLCAGLAAGLALLRRWAFRRRLQPEFLGATEYRALMALSDVIVQGPEEAVPPTDIASNVDGYLARIRARRRVFHRVGLVAMQLHPLIYLKAPFSELDEESRLDHLETHFHRAVRLKLIPEAWRHYVQVMLRIANQLAYLGYYSDRRSFPAVGYEPFPERARYAALDRAGKIPTPGEHPLTVSRPDTVNDLDVEAGVCIIGSGAAGAILAYRLAEAGEDVVVLERGHYVEPREFNSDEVEMIGKLYADGVFQQSEDFRFTVLQGSCVGGSTVVNNAVSIPLPQDVLQLWNQSFRAGIEPQDLFESSDHIERWLEIAPLDSPGDPDVQLNPSYPKFLNGVDRRRQSDPDFRLDVSTARANIKGCLGSGYCNIGCRWGKKLSMLDTVLPWAQREFGEDRVRIFAECEVRRIVTEDGGPRHVGAVRAKLADGRTLTIRTRKTIVSAGAVASPYLLLRSGVGKGLPVGRHVSFNMGAPLTAEFDEDLDAYDGVQISHIGRPSPERGWVYETWWNPPVSQALNMPGWFGTHYENMRRYRRLMAVGALVGTERNARIGRALTGGPAIHYTPTPPDMRKLADALVELGHILFAAGAKSIMVNGWDYYRFMSPNGLYELPTIMRDPTQVTLGTGHPQGGNAISSDAALGVVDPDFRVHGYSNLYVCDASVFPTSITVNPQLTVMALANYAAPRIAEGTQRTG